MTVSAVIGVLLAASPPALPDAGYAGSAPASVQGALPSQPAAMALESQVKEGVPVLAGPPLLRPVAAPELAEPPILKDGAAPPVLRQSDSLPPSLLAPEAPAVSPDILHAQDETSEIVVTARSGHANDPLKAVNTVSFDVTQAVDRVVLGPIARVHEAITPKPIRHGIRNFLNNLRESVVMVNFVLQLKIGKAAETVGRFAINSTLGIAGVVDVAKRCPFHLPWRPNGFGDTLGVYGVKEGPYIFVPLLGPTTLRDLAGGVVDRVASPLALGGPFKSRAYVLGSNIYRAIDRRAEMEDELREVRESDDPYTARRDLYLKKQQDRVRRLRGGGKADERSGPDPAGELQSGPNPPRC